jgi:hypothetical protein
VTCLPALFSEFIVSVLVAPALRRPDATGETGELRLRLEDADVLRGRASLTVSVRPLSSRPLSALITALTRTVVHRDERKSTRFTRHAVHHQMNFVDAMLFEQILKIVLSGLKREITYVQFHCVLNLEKLPSYRAVPENRVSNHQ